MPKSIYRSEYRAMLAVLLAARARCPGLSQGEVAAALGHAQSTLSHLERGARRLDLVEFIDYCRVVGVDPRQAFDAVLVEIVKGTDSKTADLKRQS